MIDSKLFNGKQIETCGSHSTDKASEADLLILYWPDCTDYFEKLNQARNKKNPVIIYTPSYLDKMTLKRVNEIRNLILVQYRGRFLNDVFTTAITTK